ncbi:MAG: phenylacetate--CoA ligase family protein [Blautia sp.]|nr:phenylacetate--CoA ligase family protein [Blautia sp.]
MKQAGEIIRRMAFWGLDMVKGGRQKKIKMVNKREIVEGITEDYAKRRTRAILAYAREQCAFYKDIPSLSLQDFPVMTKMDYNAKRDQILSDEYQEKKDTLYKLKTSGSTGAPFTVLCDREKMIRYNMNYISFMELNGFRMGMKRGEFRVWIEGKNKITKWKSLKNNLLMIDISNMGDEALQGICRRIQKERIQVLVCYSSALGPLLNYIRKYNVDIRKWDVEMIFAMGEGLPQTVWEGLTETFGFSPVRSYGNNENGFLACEIQGEGWYTADLYNFYIEILKMDSDEPADSGELGRVVITDYYNRAFPMIRYDTGDTALYEEICDGRGRIHGYFNEIYGRRGSLLYNCDGEPLSMHCFLNVLIDLEDVVHQAKCIQWEKTRYELLLNADPEKVDEQMVINAYKQYLGDAARIDVTYVDEIPVEASGKRMVCENRMVNQ